MNTLKNKMAGVWKTERVPKIYYNRTSINFILTQRIIPCRLDVDFRVVQYTQYTYMQGHYSSKS